MLEFNIQVAGGSLVEINEPIGFDKVDFNLTRSETLHSISSNFAGNSIEFEFHKDVHINVFESIIQEYEVNGFLGDVILFITYNSNELFKGSFDFSTTQTDMLNYLKCQIVNKDKLYLLDKNKNVAIDLLSDNDLDQNTVAPAPISSLSLPPVELFKESIFNNEENIDYDIFRDTNTNITRNNTKYEINDTTNWLSDQELRTESYGRNFQLISAKENLKGITVGVHHNSGSKFQRLNVGIPGTAELKLYLLYGEERPDLNDQDWYNQVNKVVLWSISISDFIDYNIPENLTMFISS